MMDEETKRDMELIVPAAISLLAAGLMVGSAFWGEDSAQAAASARDGRSIRSALRPE